MKRKIYLGLFLLLTLGYTMPKAFAQTYTISSTTLEYAGCDSLFYRLGISPSSPIDSSLYVINYFGDGSTSLDTILFNTPARFYVGHNYSLAGVYTVKSILYLDGVALDSIVFEDTVNLCSTIHIASYVDHNADCIFDAGDTYMPNPYTIEVDSAGIAVDTLTSTSFYYATSPGVSTGTIYTFKIITEPGGYIVSCPGSGIIYDTVGSTMPSSLYKSFGFVCDTSSFDLHVWGWFSPGLTGACSHVYAYEYGCSPVSDATLIINYSTKYVYSSTSTGISPTSSGTGWATFDLGAMAPDSVAAFIVYFTAAGTPTLGDTTNTTWTIDPIIGDAHPANNIHSEVDTIRSSYDPNEKSVSPQGYILAGTQLQYAIGFENTGNDTAFNVHVQDTLSANLDVSTFKLVSASAAVTTEVTHDAAGQSVIKFDFPHINLLDASHPGKNTGMVVFTINAKNGLANGTVIDNRGGIYFDYNPVVITNTTTNIIGTPTGIAIMNNVAKIDIYPNPVSDVLTINMENCAYNTINIVNSIGETFITRSLNAAQMPVNIGVNVKALTAGLYFVYLQGNNGTVVKKFIKE